MRLRLGYLRDCSRRSRIIWRAKSTWPCVTLSEPSKELPNAMRHPVPEHCAVKGCAEPDQPVRDGTSPRRSAQPEPTDREPSILQARPEPTSRIAAGTF